MAGIILYDHVTDWQNLLPFTFTRPVSEIRIGIMKISEKWVYYLENQVSFLTKDYLSEKYPVSEKQTNYIINSSVLPDHELAASVKSLKEGHALFLNDLFIAALINRKEMIRLAENNFQSLTRINYSGKVKKINYCWDIFRLNQAEIVSDFEIITKNRKTLPLPKSNRAIGQNEIFIEEGASVECALLNATEGPVYIGKHAEIMEGSILRGPLALCEHSTVKIGAKIYTGTTIGPYCKVGGEINNSVFFSYSNKSHDGFIGNAVIGEWCNIGAGTNNSNLKNNYELVKVWNYTKKEFINTGLQFCGLFMGDHSKCSINTMFNTGTTVGVCVNIFGAGFPRTFIPSFCWGGAAGFTMYDLEKTFKTAEIVMQRRNIRLTEADKKILAHVFEITPEYKK